jgi:hypothetical protein
MFMKIWKTVMAGMLFTAYSYGAVAMENKLVVSVLMDDFIFQLVVPKPKPDLLPPAKARLLIAPPETVYEDTVDIKLSGEPDASVYINGRYIGKIGEDGTLLYTLDTSGPNGTKRFDVVLKDDAGNNSETLRIVINKTDDPKYDIVYKGLVYYKKSMEMSSYTLAPLDDAAFNRLSDAQKRQVADKLLTTLFFGYPLETFNEKIRSGTFISSLFESLKEERNDKESIETLLGDDEVFVQFDRWAEPQAIRILTRFYALPYLDRYYVDNWTAYILTQTIMFSPAYELDTTHTPDIGNVYNRIVTLLQADASMRFITYVHMLSVENWRRFRSPEDNGREMMEIFLLDEEDSHVPIAATALKNWKLNDDGDTLEIGLDENTRPLELFGTVIRNGDDFYRELVKTDQFVYGVTKRLVDFFFTETSETEKNAIIEAIVRSHPETWKDILLQIVFSEKYLLHTQRTKSAEETFYSYAKKLKYKHSRSSLYLFKRELEHMHQASMKYKLGKLQRVPLDTLSFAYYHKFIRERLFIRHSNPNSEDVYDRWDREGWSTDFVTFDHFSFDENDPQNSLRNFINYIFNATLYRNAYADEMQMFVDHMIYEEDGEQKFHWAFDMAATYNDAQRQAEEREKRKINIATTVLEYISRLAEIYTLKKVQ